MLIGESAFLIDRFDTKFARFRNRKMIDLLPVEKHLAAVGLIVTGDDLDQRRLSSTIVAEQTDDFVLFNAKIDVAQRTDFAK